MASQADGLSARMETRGGVRDWLTTTDHKKIGILYMVTAFVFLLAGVSLAVLMRTQLAVPNNGVLGPEAYNQVFTMHGTTMIFLFLMPMLAGIGNYMIPLMIGARDMAFPRLNAFSYWVYLFGALFMYSSFAAGAAPNFGWFAYAPLSERISPQATPGPNAEFWILSLLLLGISSTGGAINFAVTTIKLRAKGMTFNRMPLFVWANFVTAFIIIFAFPAITAAAILLFLDRQVGTGFYLSSSGGDPLLWQHLFWSFGHPEVYILVLPAMGIISEVLPVFSRKPAFGYPFIAWSTVAIGFLSFTVWAHHMFAVGMPNVAQGFFALTSMFIAVPTGVKIYNWIGTMWGGQLHFGPALFFAVGFIAQFIIGGITGVFVAVVPFDWQVTDTYFVVAHFHYTLLGGTLFGLFAGMYYWFPKITGRFLNAKLGVLHFVLTFIGFNLTFFPLHFAGLLGMPRRIYTYQANLGWDTLNLVSSVGAYFIALSFILLLWLIFKALRGPKIASADPWDGWTLEWATTSPPPPWNFAEDQSVHSRRPLWDLKHPENPDYKAQH